MSFMTPNGGFSMYPNGTADIVISSLALYSLNQLKSVPLLVNPTTIT
jgi:hypothetical protein